MASRRGAALLLALVTVAAGCARSSARDKAGGRAESVVTLTFATTGPSLDDVPAVREFVRHVAMFSNGALRIDVRYQWGNLDPDSEAMLVRAVAADKVDLGWTGSRVFDRLGVGSFRALSAPMLIDSYPLEEEVFGSQMPNQMLAALTHVHVTGLGIFGDSLRHPVGVHRALLAPAAWRGLHFGTYPSRTQDEAIEAVGAHPRYAFSQYRLHYLQAGQLRGFEFDLFRYDRNKLWLYAPYVAANVVLWPQVDVVIANPHRLASLTGRQRTWLSRAAAAAAADSLRVASQERLHIHNACAHGVHFAYASSADLAAFRRAFHPLYAALDRDPRTRAYIRRIEALKRALGSEPARSSHDQLRCRP
jgi:TRAP-type transport system periplasmic protein